MTQLLPAEVLRQVLLRHVPGKSVVMLELAPEGRSAEYRPSVCKHTSASACPDGLECRRIHAAR